MATRCRESPTQSESCSLLLLLTRPSKYFASFGGLLLYIEGPFKKLTGLKIDNIYMLLKR